MSYLSDYKQRYDSLATCTEIDSWWYESEYSQPDNCSRSEKINSLCIICVVDPDKNEENSNAHFQLAYSTNQGKTWTDKPEKVEFPLPLKNEFNPTVCWDDIHAKWMMMTIVVDQTVKFFSSSDLLSWKFESSLEKELQYTANIWQKVSIFPINNGSNWVMLVDQEFVNPP